MKNKVSKEEILDAVTEGVDRAVWRMITGITDMPSFDFWEAMDKAMKNAFYEAVSDKLSGFACNEHTERSPLAGHRHME